MGWSVLRRLDLGHRAPRYMLAALMRNVPPLKTLSFGFWRNYRPASTWDRPDLDVVRQFLDSVDGLKELAVTNWAKGEFDLIQEDLFVKHRATLWQLRVSYSAAEAQ